MKTLKHLLLLCFLVVLTACSEDAFVTQSEVPSADGTTIDLISMTVPDVQMEDASTRSLLYEDGEELKFSWEENDAIGVVPLSGFPIKFPINADNAGKNTALFDGGDWALKTSTKYAAFFPFKKGTAENDIRNIPIDYTGQTQDNFTDYDFLATGAIQPKNGEVKFEMQRLSAILRITITMPHDSHARYFSLTASDAPFGVKGTLDLSGTEPVYTPTAMAMSIHTDMGKERTSTSAWTFTAYMIIPPVDLSGKTLRFRAYTDEGYSYEGSWRISQSFEAGKVYQLTGSATGSVIYNQNLIAAAKQSNSEVGTFSTYSDGSVPVNFNLEELAKVTRLYIDRDEEDPTICDEIGYFVNLSSLTCYKVFSVADETKITSLDVSSNKKLTYLSCGYNLITSLDVSNNKELGWLSCNNNKLSTLDVSNNTALYYLYCPYNQLSSLDVSKNTLLTNLSCSNNQLTSLDVSKNRTLTYLSCGTNKLTTLNLSKNTLLTQLGCGNNQLTLLDVSKNTLLTYLGCSNNQLTSLDVSKNTELKTLFCESNQLSALNITQCSSLQFISNTYFNCGRQKTSSGTDQELILTVTEAQLTEIHNNFTSFYNLNPRVTIVQE